MEKEQLNKSAKTILNKDVMFIRSKMTGMENDNPKLNRIISEFSDIINANILNISNEAKKEIENIIFETYKTMVSLEKLLLKYFKKLDESTKNLLIYIQNNNDIHNFEWENPSYELESIFKEFLINCSIVFKYRTKIAILIFNDNTLSDHDKLRKCVNKNLLLNKEKIGVKNYTSLKEMLTYDREWVPKLIEFRNDVEHPEHRKLDITDFKFTLQDYTIYLPKLNKINIYVHLYMKTTFYNIYTYFEDYIAMLFMFVISNESFEIKKLVEVSKDNQEEKINDIGSFKYILDLKDKYKDKWFHDLR